MASLAEMQAWVSECTYPEYTFKVITDGRGAIYLQGFYLEKDIHTGVVEEQQTRRWFLSPEMVKSEVVLTCFKCIITSAEHRVREHFTYNGRQICAPHLDVAAMWEIAERIDSRNSPVVRDNSEKTVGE